MDEWAAAWASDDVAGVAACYDAEAILLHPRYSAVQGPTAIAEFLGGGTATMTVEFHARMRHQEDNLAFEWGEFRDLDRSSGELIAKGDYAATFVGRAGTWKLLHHSWNELA